MSAQVIAVHCTFNEHLGALVVTAVERKDAEKVARAHDGIVDAILATMPTFSQVTFSLWDVLFTDDTPTSVVLVPAADLPAA